MRQVDSVRMVSAVGQGSRVKSQRFCENSSSPETRQLHVQEMCKQVILSVHATQTNPEKNLNGVSLQEYGASPHVVRGVGHRNPGKT